MGYTALIWAGLGGHHDIIHQLLGRADIDADHVNGNGHCALFVAAANGHVDAVRALLSAKNLNPNIKDR